MANSQDDAYITVFWSSMKIKE